MSERMVYPGAVVGPIGNIKKEICPSCGSDDVKKTAKVWKCNACGRSSQSWKIKKCPNCKRNWGEEDQFCMECGAKLGEVPKGQKMVEADQGLSTRSMFVN